MRQKEYTVANSMATQFVNAAISVLAYNVPSAPYDRDLYFRHFASESTDILLGVFKDLVNIVTWKTSLETPSCYWSLI